MSRLTPPPVSIAERTAILGSALSVRLVDLPHGKLRKHLVRHYASLGIDPATMTMKLSPDGEPRIGDAA